MIAFSICGMLAFVVFMTTLITTIRFTRRYWDKIVKTKSLSVVQTTNVFIMLDSVFIVIHSAYELAYTTLPYKTTALWNGRIIKKHTFEDIQYVSIFVFFFGSLAVLNVTLLWWSLALTFQHLRTENVPFFVRFRSILIVYYIGFAVASIACTILFRVQYVLYISIVAVVGVLIFCIIAMYKLKVVGQFLADAPRKSPHESADAWRVMTRIRKYAFLVMICLTCFLTSLVVNALSDRENFANDRYSIAFACFWLMGTTLVAILAAYVHPMFPINNVKMFGWQGVAKLIFTNAAPKTTIRQQVHNHAKMDIKIPAVNVATVGDTDSHECTLIPASSKGRYDRDAENDGKNNQLSAFSSAGSRKIEKY